LSQKQRGTVGKIGDKKGGFRSSWRGGGKGKRPHNTRRLGGDLSSRLKGKGRKANLVSWAFAKDRGGEFELRGWGKKKVKRDRGKSPGQKRYWAHQKKKKGGGRKLTQV